MCTSAQFGGLYFSGSSPCPTQPVACRLLQHLLLLGAARWLIAALHASCLAAERSRHRAANFGKKANPVLGRVVRFDTDPDTIIRRRVVPCRGPTDRRAGAAMKTTCAAAWPSLDSGDDPKRPTTSSRNAWP